MNSKHLFFWLLALSLLFTSCATGSYLQRKDLKTLNEMLDGDDLNHHMGFLLQDLSTGKVIKEYNSDQYFTPASNTKILTLALGLEVLGDSIPFVEYYREIDTIYIKGLGDPTFLHPDFESARVLEFLGQAQKVVVDLSNFENRRLGSGWSWDDYNGAYQIERSSLPIYGNMLVFKNEKPAIPFFNDVIEYDPSSDRLKIQRAVYENHFHITGRSDEENEKVIPLAITDSLIVQLLEDTLGIPVQEGVFNGQKSVGIIYSHPIDSLYRPMMENSDNFFADQIVMMSSQKMLDRMAESEIIKEAKSSFLKSIDEYLWFDGSGLSRYNQLTPRAIVQLLGTLEDKYGLDRLQGIFPQGGNTGTIKNWYGGSNGSPFVFAKTGTMRNVHCLSGYLKGDSGKWYLFSFMHNNFPGGSSSVKQPMEKILNFLKSEL